jgi:hypothetical protein
MKRPKVKKISLLETQRAMGEVVMRPLAAWRTNRTWVDGRKTADVISAFIKPNDRLSSLERIEIYNKQYWYRLIESFGDDFPGLRAVLGVQRFDRLTMQYLEKCPSRSYTLRNLGQFLLPFLRKNSDLTSPRTEIALDMARFELAQIEAFDASELPAFSADDVMKEGQNPAKLKLSLQPHIQLLDLHYPLDDFLISVKKKDARVRREASNAVEEGTKVHVSRSLRLPKREMTWLAVHRFKNVLYYKRMTHEAFTTLSALRDGAPLQKALTLAVAASGNPEQNWPALIQEWFADWTQLGWFCKPASKK